MIPSPRARRLCLIAAACLMCASLAGAQTTKPLTEGEVGAWLNQKYDCQADSPPPYFWRFDFYDFAGDGRQEALVVASTCETGTAGPDVHSVLSRNSDGEIEEWKIAEVAPSTYDNLFGNRNSDLSFKNGNLIETFYDDADRDTPLVITRKWNGKEFAVVSIQKTAVFKTSYDCAKATEEIERAICHVESLAKLDVELSGVYKSLTGKLAAPERDTLKSEQRDWLAKRDRQCGPYKGWVGCLTGMYKDRTAELQKRLEHTGIPTLR